MTAKADCDIEEGEDGGGGGGGGDDDDDYDMISMTTLRLQVWIEARMDVLRQGWMLTYARKKRA